MNGFVLNLLLALAWVAISGDVSLGNLVIGFGLGLVVLFFTQSIVGQPTYLLRMWRILNLLVFFVWELILANLRLAYDVLTPGYHLRPGVVVIPLDACTDMEITLLANMITLTPGSFSLDVSADRRVLYVHAMYLDEDVDELRGRYDLRTHRLNSSFATTVPSPIASADAPVDAPSAASSDQHRSDAEHGG